MQNKPLRKDLAEYLKKHNLVTKFNKQLKLLLEDFKYPSLHVEILEPKKLKIYSFRIDRKYRALFIITDQEIEIINITDHYQ